MSDISPLSELEKTGLLPLWGRKYWHDHETVEFTDVFADKVVTHTDYNFSHIDKTIGEFGLATWGSRSLKFDKVTREYLKKNPNGWVLNFGVGLDDPFARLDNSQATFIDYDYAPVLDYRDQFIIPDVRRIVCRGSFLSMGWVEMLQAQEVESPLLLLSGVSMYLSEDEIFNLINTFFDNFPTGECHFDALSPYGIYLLNTGMEKSRMPKQKVKFGLNKTKPLKKLLGPGYKVERQSIFEKEVVNTLNWKTKVDVFCANCLKLSNFFSIRYER